MGATDSGKSAIIRALRWLIWNRPVGDAFIHYGEDGVFVNVTTDEIDTIQRAKGPGGNEYRINEQIFKAFGNDIPEDVQKILNMDEVNLQQQLDAPFLISNSPGEVAAFFNKIAHLDQIDFGTKNIQSEIRKITGKILHGEDQLKILEVQIGKYDFLGDFEAKLVLLESKNTELASLQSQKAAIEGIIEQIEEDEILLEEYETLIGFEKDVDAIIELIDEKQALENEHFNLERHLDAIENLDDDIKSADENIQELEKELKEQMPNICPLCEQPINK